MLKRFLFMVSILIPVIIISGFFVTLAMVLTLQITPSWVTQSKAATGTVPLGLDWCDDDYGCSPFGLTVQIKNNSPIIAVVPNTVFFQPEEVMVMGVNKYDSNRLIE